MQIPVEVVTRITLTSGDSYICPDVIEGFKDDGKAFLVIRDPRNNNGLMHINKAHILRIYTNVEEREINDPIRKAISY